MDAYAVRTLNPGLNPGASRAFGETALATAALVAILFGALFFTVTTANMPLLAMQLVWCSTIGLAVVCAWVVATFSQLSSYRFPDSTQIYAECYLARGYHPRAAHLCQHTAAGTPADALNLHWHTLSGSPANLADGSANHTAR